MDVKLYVGNLSPETSEDDLRALFAQAGTVTSVALINDRATGQSKGFAFVEMTTPAEAQQAIDRFNAYTLADRELKVSVAKPREARSSDQGQPNASSLVGREPQVKTSKTRSPGAVQSGYQSRYSAFGAGNSGPTAPRRRGGSQRR